MHLLFLGIVKRILNIQTDWAKARSIQTEFALVATTAIGHVADLQLPWCTVLPINIGGFGGWVSENYLGLARVFDWYASFFLTLDLDESLDAPDPEQMPDTPGQSWTHETCNTWYTTHQVPHRLRPKWIASKRQHIRRLIEQGEHTSRRSHPPTRQLLLLLTRLTHVLVSSVMVPGAGGNVGTIGRLVRVYLSVCKHYDKVWRKSQNTAHKKQPFWIACFNFCSLMNLDSILYEYGSLQSLWEGGFQGEKILTRIKPLVTRGMAHGFHKAIVNRFQMDKSCTRFLRRMDGDVDNAHKPRFGKMYHSVKEVRDSMVQGRPLVVVWYPEGPIGCVVQGHRKERVTTLQFVPLQLVLDRGWMLLNELTYWTWQYPLDNDLRDLPGSAEHKETLFLPFLFDRADDAIKSRGRLLPEDIERVTIMWGKELMAKPDNTCNIGRGRWYHVIDAEWQALTTDFVFEAATVGVALGDRISDILLDDGNV